MITIPLRFDGLSTLEDDWVEVVVGACCPVTVALVGLAAAVLAVWILVVAYASRNLK